MSIDICHDCEAYCDTDFGEGEYIEIKEGERLLFSWSKFTSLVSGEREATPKSMVEIVFLPKGTGTSIRLTHFRIANDAVRKGFSVGWNNAFTALTILFGAGNRRTEYLSNMTSKPENQNYA